MSGRRQSQRERVYCHRCESEWFHDEQGLSPCPECNNQITEILDSEDDPRLSDAPSPFQSAPSPHRHPFADHNPWHQNPFGTQDPDEDDIHHFQFGLGNGRFWTGSPQPPNNRGGLPPFPGNMFGPNMFGNFHPGMPPTPPPDRSRGPGSDTRPEGLDHVVSSFTNMLNSMGGMDRFNMEWEDANPHNAQNRGPNGQPSRPERTRSTPGFRRRSPSDAGPGSPRIEIYATSSNMDQPLHIRSSARRVNPNDLNNRGGPVPFEDLSQLVGSIFGHHVNSTSQSPTGNGPAPAASTIFSALSAMMNRNVAAANGVEMGDAVFSDEALDRIMSQLMNDHPTGGAPPPASTEAIDALPRVKATKTHLGEEGKADCTICTEEIKVGDEIVVLPCSHWFDERCARSWLSEHDTCPVCRAGITPKEGSTRTVRTPTQAPLHDNSPASLLRRMSSGQSQSQPPAQTTRRQTRRPSRRGGDPDAQMPGGFPNTTGTSSNPIVIEESPTADRRRPRNSGTSRRSSGQSSSQREAHDSSSGSSGERRSPGILRRIFGSSGNSRR